jgi:hypothetical protein
LGLLTAGVSTSERSSAASVREGTERGKERKWVRETKRRYLCAHYDLPLNISERRQHGRNHREVERGGTETLSKALRTGQEQRVLGAQCCIAHKQRYR